MAMMQQQLSGYPDARMELTKGSIADELGIIREFYGPPKYQTFRASEGRPLDSTTLAYEYEGNNEHITDIFHTNFVDGTGWFFAFAPLRRTLGMNQSVSVYSFDRHAMEPAPEDTVPRDVTHRREDFEEGLTRYNVGSTARHDWFKRPEGRKLMEMNYTSMISGGWITAKMIIQQAVANGKSHWATWEMMHGTAYANVMEAMQTEIEQFGALSKDNKAIYKLYGAAQEATRDQPVDFNMIVLGKGSLNFLAFSSTYETEVYRRGEAVVQERLSLGAKSMKNLFPGVTIWEDDVFTLQNVGPDQINQFVRTATIGRYMVVDGSDFGEHMETYPASKVLSIKHASMDIDNWKKLSIYTLIDKCCRWKPGTDDLEDWVQGLIDNHEAVLQGAGVKLHHEDLLDPYVWRDTSYVSKNSPTNSGYHVIEHWGDMDKHYFTIRQNALFGERAAKLVRKELKETELEEIRQLKSLIDQLYNVEETIDESVEGFFFAVTANPENKQKPGSTMLKANRHGCVQLPSVDANVGIELTKSIRGMETAGSALPNGALYIVDPATQRRHYVWAAYPEAPIDNKIVVNRDDQVFGGVPRDIPVTGVTITVQNGQALGLPGHPAFYFLAPINTFGYITPTGEAPRWWAVDNTDPRSQDDRPVESLAGYRSFVSRIKFNGSTSNITEDVGSDMMGIRSVKLVNAPGTPVGYGLITGMRTLAQMYNDKNSRGWDMEMCKTASAGMASADKMARILIRMTPGCELLDTRYTLAYMESQNEETNKINNLLSNLFDHVKYPVWSRLPGPLSQFGDLVGIQTSVHGDKTVRPEQHKPQIERSVLEAILHGMGFGVEDGQYVIGPTRVPGATLLETLREILHNVSVDAKIREACIDSSKRKRLFANYESKVGKATAEYLLKIGKGKHSAKFASAFALLVSAGKVLSQRVDLFNALLGMAGSNNVVTADDVSQVVQRSKNFREVKSKTYSAAVDDTLSELNEASERSGTDSDYTGYSFINTRLTLSDSVWHSIAGRAEGADVTTLTRLANHTLRPSDPANPYFPLARFISGNGGSDMHTRDQLRTLQHARAGQKGRLSGTVFASTHMSRYGGFVDSHDVEADEDLEQDIRKHKYSPFKQQPQHLPPTLVNDMTSPLYSKTITDREYKGTLDPDSIQYKKWLLYRFEKLSEKMSDDIARMAALMLCLAKVKKSALTNWVKEGLPIPDCCYIFAQPWIRILTSAALFAEGGPNTAQTGYNYEDAVLSFNGMNKLWHLHYTIWMNCM